ncbi:MAG: Abi family protein [Mangrovibacterium sp.]
MNYNKLPLSISEQIERLQSRGLAFDDENRAAHYLSNISYYRLRAYTYPFQDNDDPNHPFIKKVNFEDIISLYVFDRRLRFIVFNALEKVEIALRTKIVYEMAVSYGSHWYENPDLFKNNHFFEKNSENIKRELARSKEDFIEHYMKTYQNPSNPPSWMTLEVVSMNTLSLLFNNVVECDAKKRILTAFGHQRYDILISWIHAFVGLRNVCAHHGRLWNSRFTISPKIPYNTKFLFLNNRNFVGNKLYALLCCLNYTLRIVSPNCNFVPAIKAHLKTCGLINLHQMGFPKNWESEPLWNSDHVFEPIKIN